MEIHPLTCSGVGPSTIVHPHVIVIKEDPDWKISKNNGSTSDLRIKPFFLEIEEEPELEIAVSVGGEFAEDPLKISSTENEETSTIEEPSFDDLWQISNSEDEQHSEKEEHACDKEVAMILSGKPTVQVKEEVDTDLYNEEREGYVDIDDEEQKLQVNTDDNEEVQVSPKKSGKLEDELVDTNEEKTISTQYSSSNENKVNNDQHSTQNRKTYSLRRQRSVLKRYSPEVNFRIRNVSKKQNKDSGEIFRKPTPVHQHNVAKNKTPFIDNGILYVDVDRRKHVDRQRARNRRFELSEYFDVLKSFLPQILRKKYMTQSDILERSTIFVTNMFRRELFLKEVVSTLKKKRCKLQTKISRLKARLVYLRSPKQAKKKF